uniref:Uncharacterized protein C11orf42-like n=1 Tax=Saccoglossus kowalevskii TaxID=10224 RepID=A0ABM0M121_SACKO|nr:PREDICTED: uncharacterized protein C11orf42-like [Saccoglossus kowalevskii]
MFTIMDRKVYNAFTAVEDISLAWTLVQDDTVKQLLGRPVNVVPFLQHAEKFDLRSVYVKEKQNLVDKMMKKPPTYEYVGKLEEVVDQGKINMQDIKHMSEAHRVEEEFSNSARYRQTDLVQGLRKTIDIDMAGIEKYVSQLTVPGALGGLFINKLWLPPLRKAKKIYIIDEVYYGDRLRVTTCVGGKEHRHEFSGKTPFAFNIMKVKLSTNGAVMGGKDVKPAIKRKRVPRWLCDIPMLETVGESQDNVTTE